MLSSSLRAILLGLVFCLLGGVLIFLGMARGSGGFTVTGVGCLVLSGVIFALGVWISRQAPDILDRRREQRLWKSGPLGRKWLESRRRIP
ncbi:MAG: hypothetical protein ACQET1_08590 [Gemmatimonadota bacterium]